MKYLVIAAAVMVASSAQAQPAHDAAWPCIQRKQPSLSLAQDWTGPVLDQAAQELARDPAIRALAAQRVLRRIPIEQAETMIAGFAADAGTDATRLTALVQAVFDLIQPERAAMIEGIARYGVRLVELTQKINDRRAAMAALESADPPDFDAIDAEKKALDWDERIFNERCQSLTYVCETPVIMEQRAFALGRAIAGHLDQPAQGAAAGSDG
ncbi:MAG: hypothetical protein Q4G14_04890 [Paracoccus sp. (in: a-proteobacteria)]|uniref:hypothetical protein n=1 Tax=Paracoccus sp. TaxID=267 RepID=UPI0026DF870B|nr:hypothetical protein [Paracoccus sp. (in: a-proteobacteria)]MDO5612565.1 hypothetical protein [Paracoccus sp. (in: a-proteobacteria)]